MIVPVADAEDQIRAILGPNIFRWAEEQLPPDASIDDFRFSDLVSVTEEDVFAYVQDHGFDPRVVAERDAAKYADDRICLVPEPDGRFRVYYTERGIRSDERVLPSEVAARRWIVHDLIKSARISLNHRYKLAHPDEDLPRPSEM
jgi:hypothetical protein